MTRRPVVGVMGSGRDEHVERAEPLGRALAARGVHLLTGGGRGVMTSVTRAFVEAAPREGLALAVLPGDERGRAPDGYPNPFVELVLRTHLPHSGERGTEATSRNHLNVLSADVVVALPGGAGTASEVELALRYGRPVVAWWPDGAPVPAGAARASSCDEVCAFVDAALAAR